MIVASTRAELDQALAEIRGFGKTVGFVPTMGALHRGHAALLERSVAENDVTVLSIYVNPTQFGKNEDLAKYPRTFASDRELASKAGVDIIFHPTDATMYPPGDTTFIDVAGVSAPLCGRFRPGHFRGVTTVVERLFRYVRPTRAYFGQKDMQQCLVIERMVRDLELPVGLVFCPTIREADGLALSSRNAYLSPEDRERAPLIQQSLQEIAHAFAKGERSVAELEALGRARVSADSAFKIQYLEVLTYPDLERVESLNGPGVAAIAAFLGETRLIDNILLESPQK